MATLGTVSMIGCFGLCAFASGVVITTALKPAGAPTPAAIPIVVKNERAESNSAAFPNPSAPLTNSTDPAVIKTLENVLKRLERLESDMLKRSEQLEVIDRRMIDLQVEVQSMHPEFQRVEQVTQ